MSSTRKALAPASPIAQRQIAIQGFFARPGMLRAAGAALQRKASIQLRPGSEAFPVDLRPKSGGWPLPREVQTKMESALGANFADVRIHVGPEAASIGAVAFTWGSDIHFSPGQYNPHTPHGQFLLGHELTHVVQQRAGRVANPFGSGVAVVQDQALEAEADRMGKLAATSPTRTGAGQSGVSKCGPAVVNCKPAPSPAGIRHPGAGPRTTGRQTAGMNPRPSSV